MKTSELKIGNYISAKGVANEIIGIRPRTDNAEEYLVLTKQGVGDLEFFKPIPLTEEWLLKFGFKNDEYGRLRFKHFMVLLTKDGWSFQWSLQDSQVPLSAPYCTGCDLEYVHQLQNLIYALTGEELKIL